MEKEIFKSTFTSRMIMEGKKEKVNKGKNLCDAVRSLISKYKNEESIAYFWKENVGNFNIDTISTFFHGFAKRKLQFPYKYLCQILDM